MVCMKDAFGAFLFSPLGRKRPNAEEGVSVEDG